MFLENKIRSFGVDIAEGLRDDFYNIFYKIILGKEREREKDGEENINPCKEYFKYKGVPFGRIKGLMDRKIKFPKSDWIHKIIIGATGSGKSTWAEKYVINSNNRGVMYIDNASGASIDRILRSLTEERLRKTIVLDHSEKKYPLSVGTFNSVKDVFETDMIVNHWVDFFISNFDIKDMFRTQKIISYACKAVFALENSTILDAVKIVEDERFRKFVLSKLDRNYRDVIKFWNKFNSYSDSKQQSFSEAFLHRTEVMFRDTFLKITLGQTAKSKLEYRKWMDEKYTVLIKIPETHLGNQAVKIIAALHILGFWQAALSRKDREDLPTFVLIADEPQNWLSTNEKILDDIFSKARKYGLELMTLFQSTEQLRKESIALYRIILDNQPDILAFSETELLRRYDLDWNNLKKYHFFAKLRDCNRVFMADALGVLKFKRGRREVKEIINNYKDKYNRYYLNVLDDIERRERLWGEGVNIKEKKLKSQKNGLKNHVNQRLQKKREKLSNTSIRIDW